MYYNKITAARCSLQSKSKIILSVSSYRHSHQYLITNEKNGTREIILNHEKTRYLLYLSIFIIIWFYIYTH